MPRKNYLGVGKKSNSVGLFWQNYKEKPKPKPTIPDPFWLRDDYLPNLEKALAWQPNFYSYDELIEDLSWIPTFVFDIEHYKNYLLIMFKNVSSGKITYFEKTPNNDLDCELIEYIFKNSSIIGFNSIKYDIPMLKLAHGGASFEQLEEAQRMLINESLQPYIVLKHFKSKKVHFYLDVNDHIDLIEVCPLKGSLKTYAARLHTKQLQDLPFVPNSKLTDTRIKILRWYCNNDLNETQQIYEFLKDNKKISLRNDMSKRYNIDLRSKSDAQIAEAVISKEVEMLTGEPVEKPKQCVGDVLRYNPPSFLKFESDNLKSFFDRVVNCIFYVNEYGYIEKPVEIENENLIIGTTEYTFGIGGLHSKESKRSLLATENVGLVDIDVASYYPAVIRNQGLYPSNMGPLFLKVYGSIVDRRLDAKSKAKDKILTKEMRTLYQSMAESLKIVINGSFGKFGNRWSKLYSPKLLLQVTLTGQLSLLLLIERVELAGFKVMSGNTDGILVAYDRSRKSELDSIVLKWNNDTDFETENSEYDLIIQKSVNDYIAFTTDYKSKGKSSFGRGIDALFKNPTAFIVIKAIENYFQKGISIEETIEKETDFREFVVVRNISGGGLWIDYENGQKEYVGKVARWYYGDIESQIVTAKTGNQVATSEGAIPCLELPYNNIIPQDLDRSWYTEEAYKFLEEGGFNDLFK